MYTSLGDITVTSLFMCKSVVCKSWLHFCITVTSLDPRIIVRVRLNLCVCCISQWPLSFITSRALSCWHVWWYHCDLPLYTTLWCVRVDCTQWTARVCTFDHTILRLVASEWPPFSSCMTLMTPHLCGHARWHITDLLPCVLILDHTMYIC